MEQGEKRKKDMKGENKMRQRYDVTGTYNQLCFKGPVSKAKLLFKGKTSHFHRRKAISGHSLDQSGNFEWGNKYQTSRITRNV
jgi:hypothetical protein